MIYTNSGHGKSSYFFQMSVSEARGKHHHTLCFGLTEYTQSFLSPALLNFMPFFPSNRRCVSVQVHNFGSFSKKQPSCE